MDFTVCPGRFDEVLFYVRRYESIIAMAAVLNKKSYDDAVQYIPILFVM